MQHIDEVGIRIGLAQPAGDDQAARVVLEAYLAGGRRRQQLRGALPDGRAQAQLAALNHARAHFFKAYRLKKNEALADFVLMITKSIA